MRALAFMLVILISIAVLGYVVFSEQGAITETVQVGSEGIQKAQEVKQQLEESSRAQNEI